MFRFCDEYERYDERKKEKENNLNMLYFYAMSMLMNSNRY